MAQMTNKRQLCDAAYHYWRETKYKTVCVKCGLVWGTKEDRDQRKQSWIKPKKRCFICGDILENEQLDACIKCSS